MILKQYAINLRADCDMATIRKRVADKGASYDRFPGLGIKTFMIRERGQGRARQPICAALSLDRRCADVGHHRRRRLSRSTSPRPAPASCKQRSQGARSTTAS